MIPIIQDLLDAEKQADQIIAAAREQVQREQITWDGEEHSRLQAATRAIEERVQAGLSQAREEALSRQTIATRESIEDSNGYESTKRDEIDQAIGEVVAEICRSEVEPR